MLAALALTFLATTIDGLNASSTPSSSTATSGGSAYRRRDRYFVLAEIGKLIVNLVERNRSQDQRSLIPRPRRRSDSDRRSSVATGTVNGQAPPPTTRTSSRPAHSSAERHSPVRDYLGVSPRGSCRPARGVGGALCHRADLQDGIRTIQGESRARASDGGRGTSRRSGHFDQDEHDGETDHRRSPREWSGELATLGTTPSSAR